MYKASKNQINAVIYKKNKMQLTFDYVTSPKFLNILQLHHMVSFHPILLGTGEVGTLTARIGRQHGEGCKVVPGQEAKNQRLVASMWELRLLKRKTKNLLQKQFLEGEGENKDATFSIVLPTAHSIVLQLCKRDILPQLPNFVFQSFKLLRDSYSRERVEYA